ncbi:hypothetical protein WJX84_006824 [Apatococcus fuscideae]|uniref:Uncharacterized protein n=1 Tax=Apatococcus fuscideae TaxID=2026836 RepID=A0AAW1S913_9CHLO
MGCCCSRSKRARREGTATTSSELTSSISSIHSSSLKPEAKLSNDSLKKQVSVGTVPLAQVPIGVSDQSTGAQLGTVPPERADFLRCPSGILFEDDTFFDAQEELQQEAPHQSTSLDVIFGRYENWMRQSIEGQPEQPQPELTPAGSFSQQQQPASPLSHRGHVGSVRSSPFAAAAAVQPITAEGQLQPAGSHTAATQSSQDGGRGSLEGQSFKLKKAKQRKLAKQLHDAFADGRCMEANMRLQELRHHPDVGGAQLASAAGVSLEDLDALPTRAEEYDTAVRDIRNDEGWDVARDNALRALHRHEKGTMVHSFKLSATFEHPLDRLVALAREIDLVNILDERLSGRILEQPSLFDGTFHIHVKTPWPFPRDLDLCLYACGADLSQEHRCMVILLRDSPGGLTPDQIPSSTKQQPTARLSVLPGSAIMLRPVAVQDGAKNSSSTEGHLMVHLTMDLASVPSLWIRLLLRG